MWIFVWKGKGMILTQKYRFPQGSQSGLAEAKNATGFQSWPHSRREFSQGGPQILGVAPQTAGLKEGPERRVQAGQAGPVCWAPDFRECPGTARFTQGLKKLGVSEGNCGSASFLTTLHCDCWVWETWFLVNTGARWYTPPHPSRSSFLFCHSLTPSSASGEDQSLRLPPSAWMLHTPLLSGQWHRQILMCLYQQW